jgi:RNA polymerase sigma-70 factor, ECF subfamily
VESDDDKVLLERFRSGDRSAFTVLVMRYQKPIYNAAFWVLRKAEDASDVTQTVFLKVVERIDDYDPQYKFFSWLYRIAVNE